MLDNIVNLLGFIIISNIVLHEVMVDNGKWYYEEEIQVDI